MDLAFQIDKQIADRVKLVNSFVEDYLRKMELEASPAMSYLQESMLYSATNGGKRFRPLLAILTGELLGTDTEKILPFAVAVELSLRKTKRPFPDSSLAARARRALLNEGFPGKPYVA